MMTIADRSTFDNDMLPSTEALLLHWKRSCWVLGPGQQEHYGSSIEEYGWSLKHDELQVTWDTAENMTRVRERVSVLLKGCKCTTGCRKSKHAQKAVTSCENINSPSCHDQGQSQQDLAEIVLEEAVKSSRPTDSEDEEEFADFVFAAAFYDSNDELEITDS